jgi:hypothetical protein
MFEFIVQNKTLLISVLIVGITFAIISVILGLTMQITGTMIASFVLCFLAIIFIFFGAYNLFYHPDKEKMIKELTSKLHELNGSDANPLSSEPPSSEAIEPVSKGGYFSYGN